MADTIETKKRNWIFIIGVLIMCVGMQVANYGTAVCLSGEMNSMGATDFYVLVNAFGSLGMMLILPMVGKFTAMFGLRNMITAGIIVQLAGRVLMIFSGALCHRISHSVCGRRFLRVFCLREHGVRRGAPGTGEVLRLHSGGQRHRRHLRPHDGQFHVRRWRLGGRFGLYH